MLCPFFILVHSVSDFIQFLGILPKNLIILWSLEQYNLKIMSLGMGKFTWFAESPLWAETDPCNNTSSTFSLVKTKQNKTNSHSYLKHILDLLDTLKDGLVFRLIKFWKKVVGKIFCDKIRNSSLIFFILPSTLLFEILSSSLHVEPLGQRLCPKSGEW